jgi:hypothetical protein
MEYVRKVDFAAAAAADPNERITQVMLDHSSGGEHCSINWIKTPAGGGSPAACTPTWWTRSSTSWMGR